MYSKILHGCFYSSPIVGLGVLGYFNSNNIMTNLLNSMDPETAHSISLFCLKNNILGYTKKYNSDRLNNNIMGIDFNTPIGLAAGFDKNGVAYNNLHNLGFSFVEIGSISPNPQEGNEKPRIFRTYNKITNRCGLNNDGIDIVKTRLYENKKVTDDLNVYSKNSLGYNHVNTVHDNFIYKNTTNKILGISLVKNNESIDFEDYLNDFKTGIINLQDYSDYMVLNISCPNVKNKELNIEELDLLLEHCRHICSKALLIKLSPDLKDSEYIKISNLCLKHSINGIILTNTMKSKDGGISGTRDLYNRSNDILKLVYKTVEGKIPLIGCGGVITPCDAYEKIKNGASVVQIYSSFIYNGPDIIYNMNKYIDERLEKDNFENIKDCVGSNIIV